LSRAKSMARGVYIQSSQEMIPIVSKILSDLKKEHKGAFNVRLLGIRCSNFKEESDSRQKQLDVFLVKKPADRPPAPTAPDTVSLPKRSDVHDEDETNQTREQNLALSPYRQKIVGTSSSPVRRHISSPRPSAATAAVSLPADEAVCPICSKAIPGDNDNLNRHVDACLNAGTVAKLVGESNKEADERSSKKRRVLKDFFA